MLQLALTDRIVLPPGEPMPPEPAEGADRIVPLTAADPPDEDGQSPRHATVNPNWPPTPNAFGMVGQEQLTSMLEDLVRYAEDTGSRFQDRLLIGPPGVGKSTLARAVARRLVEGGCVLLNAADCRQPKELGTALSEHGLLADAPSDTDAHDAGSSALNHVQPTVVFIDEAHALSRQMKAWLLSAMDDERIASIDGTGYDFKRVTFLLATTDPGRLSSAFQSRCDPLYLRAYTLEELAGIVWLHARTALAGAELDRLACLEIACRMRGNPRRSVRALTNALIPHAHQQLAPPGESGPDGATIASWLTAERIGGYYDRHGIDANGIDPQARAFLDYLARNGAVPAKRLRQALSLSTEADFDAIDEYLVRLGLVSVATRGRSLTNAGLAYRMQPVRLRARIDGTPTETHP